MQQDGSYAGFQGKVGRTFASSEPWWPEQAQARAGAPNVVVVLADDLGFSDLGCYGSEIPTPNIDSIAQRGLRYTNFHVTPLCSPTRAALLTGKNSHEVGVGMVSNIDPGFPGYTSELRDNQPTIAEVLRGHGYATLMLGKWHLCRDSDMNEAGDRSSWPLQRGFDQFYGFLEAMTNFHHPHRLFEGNSVVHVDEYPEDYYLTDDLTDRAERMIKETKSANPDKPFFMYFAHGAVHAPLQAKLEDIRRHRGNYDIGWDELRERRLTRQVELGVVPAGTRLPPRNTEYGLDVDAWDSLPEQERKVMARYMEVYAAMVASIDESVGRLKQLLVEMGEWDNTIFIFTSDNGASREGFNRGSSHYHRRTSPTTLVSEVTERDVELYEQDKIGSAQTWPHYPRGWAMACNTPFRLYKITTYRGGHTVPFVMHYPPAVAEPGSVVRKQYCHVTDILPTLTDLLGLELPEERNGLPAEPPTGSSFAATLRDHSAPTEHNEQYYECNGNRGYFRNGWEAVTSREVLAPMSCLPNRDDLKPLSEDKWELFNVEEDPTQVDDLAELHPEILAELQQAWEDAAWQNRVFPINEGAGLNHLRRPPGDEHFGKPVTLLPGTPTLERYRSIQLISARPFTVSAALELERGSEGVVVAHGGQEGGYVLYIEDGQLKFEENAYGQMLHLPPVPAPTGAVTVDLRFDLPDPKTWLVTLLIDGKEAAHGEFRPITGMMPWEGIDVGVDRRSPVSWALFERHGAFPFSGRIHSVTYTPEERPKEALADLIEQARVVGLALE